MMKQHNCGHCIHFLPGWVSKPFMGRCQKGKTSVNKSGFPCKFYEQPLPWWKRLFLQLRAGGHNE